jgi:hypothetical protein
MVVLFRDTPSGSLDTTHGVDLAFNGTEARSSVLVDCSLFVL